MAIRLLSLFSWLTVTRSRLEWCLRLGETRFALLKSWICQVRPVVDGSNMILSTFFFGFRRKRTPAGGEIRRFLQQSQGLREVLLYSVYVYLGGKSQWSGPLQRLGDNAAQTQTTLNTQKESQVERRAVGRQASETNASGKSEPFHNSVFAFPTSGNERGLGETWRQHSQKKGLVPFNCVFAALKNWQKLGEGRETAKLTS